MLRKLFVVGLIALNFFVVMPVFAEDPPAKEKVSKEFNPLCWQRKECEAKRAELSRNEPPSGQGFIDTSEAGDCLSKVGTTPDDADWGRCLPSNVAETEIAFGGQKKFANIGEFLTNGYKLALTVASVLATIMIVVAGFQWTASGGNASIITSAKSRIAGAIIGLFIAYTSYLILYTINPNLVNLHLPQTWLLRPQAEMPKFCSEIPKPAGATDDMFHKVFDAGDQTSKVSVTSSVNYELIYSEVVKKSENDTVAENCGKRYLAKDSGAFACFGDVCDSNKICANVHVPDFTKTNYECMSASVVWTVV